MFKVLAIINRGIKEKKKYIYVLNNNTSLDIIKILYKKGYIVNYKFYFNSIKIEFNIYQNKIVINSLKFYNHLNLQKYVTYKQLKRMIFIKNKKLLVSTVNGIIMGDLALKYKIGGLILAEFI